jgi:hypothetical protein
MPTAPETFGTKVIELSAVHHQPEKDWKFSDAVTMLYYSTLFGICCECTS